MARRIHCGNGLDTQLASSAVSTSDSCSNGTQRSDAGSSSASTSDHFHVYLLQSHKASAHARHSYYIGKTTDPKRRKRQHNGLILGGAKRTCKASKRPWEMVVVVQGFPSVTAALQFEWQWQHPKRSKIIRDAVHALSPVRQTGVRRLLQILHAMLLSKLWRNYPLDILVCDEFCFDWFHKFAEPTLPDQMTAVFGTLDDCHMYAPTLGLVETECTTPAQRTTKCALCSDCISANFAQCYHCLCRSHVTCLMANFIATKRQPHTASQAKVAHFGIAPVRQTAESEETSSLLPPTGACHECGGQLDWARILKDFYVRHRQRRKAARIAQAMAAKTRHRLGPEWTVEEVR